MQILKFRASSVDIHVHPSLQNNMKYQRSEGGMYRLQWSWGPEDMSLLERCPHFRGWYVQASMKLGPEDVSIGGWYVQDIME